MRISPFVLASWLLLALLLASCHPGSAIVERPPFFSLQDFIAQEVQRLDSLQPTVRKSITFNGERETHTIDTLAFANELSVFQRADINRPAWLDKYRVDSLREDGRLQRITYTALDEDLKTQELKVEWHGPDHIDRIEVITQSATVLSKGRQILVYEPGKGYRIETHQESRAAAPVDILIEASFQ
jgi:hypothetical protein